MYIVTTNKTVNGHEGEKTEYKTESHENAQNYYNAKLDELRGGASMQVTLEEITILDKQDY